MRMGIGLPRLAQAKKKAEHKPGLKSNREV